MVQVAAAFDRRCIPARGVAPPSNIARYSQSSRLATDAAGHSGPPFPIVTDRAAGPYTVSIWTDPDTTNDGTPGGQFWIVLSRGSAGVAPVTRVTVTAAPDAGTGATRSVDATVSARDGNTYFGALELDPEGLYRIDVDV